MEKNSGMLAGLLAVAGGLLYVGHELSKTRKMREAAMKNKNKKKNNKNEDYRVIGFRQQWMDGNKK